MRPPSRRSRNRRRLQHTSSSACTSKRWQPCKPTRRLPRQGCGLRCNSPIRLRFRRRTARPVSQYSVPQGLGDRDPGTRSHCFDLSRQYRRTRTQKVPAETRRPVCSAGAHGPLSQGGPVAGRPPFQCLCNTGPVQQLLEGMIKRPSYGRMRPVVDLGTGSAEGESAPALTIVGFLRGTGAPRLE